jgi:hypothetical protein
MQDEVSTDELHVPGYGNNDRAVKKLQTVFRYRKCSAIIIENQVA